VCVILGLWRVRPPKEHNPELSLLLATSGALILLGAFALCYARTKMYGGYVITAGQLGICGMVPLLRHQKRKKKLAAEPADYRPDPTGWPPPSSPTTPRNDA